MRGLRVSIAVMLWATGAVCTAEPVAMVTDLKGSVIQSAQKPQSLALLSYLEPGVRLRLDAGASLVITYFTRAMQVALAELWKSWGVHPAAVAGHSVSEIAAACVAGLFSLEQGARITALRAQFMEGCARGDRDGGADAARVLRQHPPGAGVPAADVRDRARRRDRDRLHPPAR